MATTSPTVLVVTGRDDPTADAVIAEIARRGVSAARCDTGDFPARSRLDAHLTAAGWTGFLHTDELSIPLDAVASVYYRRPGRFSFPPGMSDADRGYAEAETRLGFGGVLLSLDCSWLNHPHRVALAEYKPVQLSIAQCCGLRTPRTLISNNHSAATVFAEQIDGPVVCKTLSSLALAENGVHKITYTTPVEPSEIDPGAFAAAAHCIQEWIPKAYDARVTMVGDQALAVAIETDSTRAHLDWRTQYDALRYRRIDAPADIHYGMERYLARMGLSYGAFDFVVRPDGEWVMLECNPAGQWLWLHHLANLPVTAAIADHLTGRVTR